jgi:hypothetical protein
MKKISILLAVVIFISGAPFLKAGEAILYGALQKPGEINNPSTVSLSDNLREGQFGSAYGVRFSGSHATSIEENISYSPHFAKRGIKAFQSDTNLLLQARGKVAPYLTAGIGFITTWGQDDPAETDPIKIAAHAFSFGKKFSMNYGAGIKVRRVFGALGFNIDVRRFTVRGVQDDNLTFFQTSLGALFAW